MTSSLTSSASIDSSLGGHLNPYPNPNTIPSYAYSQHRIPTYPHPSHISLPLSLLPRCKLLQDPDHLLQGPQPDRQRLIDLGLVIAELLVEVLAVRGGAHGGAEDGLDDERVVRLERVAVGAAERGAEFFRGVRDVRAEGLRGEVEATKYNASALGIWERGVVRIENGGRDRTV